MKKKLRRVVLGVGYLQEHEDRMACLYSNQTVNDWHLKPLRLKDLEGKKCRLVAEVLEG